MSNVEHTTNSNEKYSHEHYNNKSRIYIDSKGNDNTMILRKNPEMKNEWKSNDINVNTLNKLRNFGCNCGCHRICNCNNKNEDGSNKQLYFKNNMRNSLNEQNILRSQSTLLNRDIPYSSSNNRNVNTYSLENQNNKNIKELLKKGLTYALKNAKKNKNGNSIKRLDLNMISGPSHNYTNTNNHRNNNNFEEFIDEKDGPLSMKSTMKSTGLMRSSKDTINENNIDINNAFKENPQMEIRAKILKNKVNSLEINNNNNNNNNNNDNNNNNYNYNNNIYNYDYNKDFDYYNNNNQGDCNCNYNNSNNNNEQLTYYMSRNSNMNNDNIFSFKKNENDYIQNNQKYDSNNNDFQIYENPNDKKIPSTLEENIKSNNYTYRNNDECQNNNNTFEKIIGKKKILNQYIPDNNNENNINLNQRNNSMNFISPIKNKSPYISGNTSFNDNISYSKTKRKNKKSIPNENQRLSDSKRDKKETERFEKEFKNANFEKLKGKNNYGDFRRIIDKIKHYRKIRNEKIKLFRNDDEDFYLEDNTFKNNNTNNSIYSIPQHYRSLCDYPIKNNLKIGKYYSMYNNRNYRDNKELNNSLQNSKILKNSSSIMPPNPYETVIKARESFFFVD